MNYLIYYIMHINYILYNNILCIILGFPDDSDGKESASTLKTQVQSMDWEDSLEKALATHSSCKESDTNEFLTCII